MTIYYRPTIKIGSTLLGLPLPITSWEESPSFVSETEHVPLVPGRSVLYHERDATRISISGLIVGVGQTSSQYDPDTALSAENAENIKKALVGYYNASAVFTSGALDSTFHLYRWTDRHYEDCICESVRFGATHKPNSVQTYSLDILACTPHWKFANALSAAGEWDLFAASSITTGGTVEMLTELQQMATVHFPGVAETDTSATERKLIIPAPSGSTVKIIGIGVTGWSAIVPGSSGTTTVEVAVASMGSGLTVDVTTTPNYTEDLDGLAIDPGDPVYIRRTAHAGGQADIEAFVVYQVTA